MLLLVKFWSEDEVNMEDNNFNLIVTWVIIKLYILYIWYISHNCRMMHYKIIYFLPW